MDPNIPNQNQNSLAQNSSNISSTSLNYAGAGVRLLALLIDVLVLFSVGFILGLVLYFALGNASSVLSNISGLVIGILYYVFYQHYAGQTLGKKVMKIRVVNEQNNKPSLVTFFLREVIGKFISGLILGIGYLMILWDSKKQGLHDKIASTYVVKV